MLEVFIYPLILIVLPIIFIWLITGYFITRKDETHPHIKSKITKAKVESIQKNYIIVTLLKDNTNHRVYFFPAGLKKDDIILVSNDILESAVPEVLRSTIKGDWFWRQNGDEIKSIYTNKREYIE